MGLDRLDPNTVQVITESLIEIDKMRHRDELHKMSLAPAHICHTRKLSR